MAALDTFHSFNNSLSGDDRERLKDRIRAEWERLLAARSEDARTRMVHEYIKDVHETLRQTKK